MSKIAGLLVVLSVLMLGCTTELPSPQAGPDANALFEQANSEFGDEKYAIAANTFTRCIEAANQADVEIHFSVYGLRGLSHYKIGKTDLALKDTTVALKTIDRDAEPNDIIARLYYQRAMIYLELEDGESASTDFESALQYDPDGALDPRTL